MMNKKILISVFLLMSVCFAGCNFKTSKTNGDNTQSPKAVTKKNAVPQTYEEWVAKNGKQQKPSKVAATQSTTTSSSPQTSSAVTAQSSTQQSNSAASKDTFKKELKGDKIPDWVYQNSVSTDDYYKYLNYPSTFILYTYQENCGIVRQHEININNAIRSAGVSGKFSLVKMQAPNSMVCHKFKERYTQSRAWEVMNERQKSVPESQRMAVAYSTGDFCIPYPVNGTISEKACDCSVNYFIEKCNNGGNICIINPRARRIVSIQPDEKALTEKLNELKNNW